MSYPSGASPDQQQHLGYDFYVILPVLVAILIFAIGCLLCCFKLVLPDDADSSPSSDPARGGAASSSASPPRGGLSKAAIRALPTVSFGEEEAASSSPAEYSSECAICLGEFAEGSGRLRLRVLPPCGHRFHVGCADQWLRKHDTSPCCRARVVAAPARASAPAVVVVVVPP